MIIIFLFIITISIYFTIYFLIFQFFQVFKIIEAIFPKFTNFIIINYLFLIICKYRIFHLTSFQMTALKNAFYENLEFK